MSKSRAAQKAYQALLKKSPRLAKSEASLQRTISKAEKEHAAFLEDYKKKFGKLPRTKKGSLDITRIGAPR